MIQGFYPNKFSSPNFAVPGMVCTETLFGFSLHDPIQVKKSHANAPNDPASNLTSQQTRS